MTADEVRYWPQPGKLKCVNPLCIACRVSVTFIRGPLC